MTYSLKQRARRVLEKVEVYLTPAPSQAIAGHVTLLLQHYYRDANIPPAVAEGLALQWISCLDSFPEWAIKRAVIKYLKQDDRGRKPVPGQIVTLARLEVGKYHALRLRCQEIDKAKAVEDNPEVTDADREAVSQIVAEAKRKLMAGLEKKGEENA